MQLLLCANKCEAAEHGDGTNALVAAGLAEGYSAGLGEPIAISAEHGLGQADLYPHLERALRATRAHLGMPLHYGGERDALEDRTRELADGKHAEREAAQAASVPTLAIVGRRNAGKSTLLNALAGRQAAVTGALPGLTRDTVPVMATTIDMRSGGGKKSKPKAEAEAVLRVEIKLVDTAGLRPASEIYRENDELEQTAVQQAVEAVKSAHVVALVVDAAALLEHRAAVAGDVSGDGGASGVGGRDGGGFGLARNDLKLVKMAVDEGKAVLLVLNKLDLLPDELTADKPALEARMRKALPGWVVGGGQR